MEANVWSRLRTWLGERIRRRSEPSSTQMPPSDIESFFNEFVFGFMAADIQRELDTAAREEPAGNFLCALALLCYTEVLGGIRRGTLAPGNGRKNFECFFREMGPEYRQLLDDGVDAYEWFRCGIAHEYLIKGAATVSMLRGVEPAGIAIMPDGRRLFCVERYFEAFIAAANTLHHDLQHDPSAHLPLELTGS